MIVKSCYKNDEISYPIPLTWQDPKYKGSYRCLAIIVRRILKRAQESSQPLGREL